MFTLKPKEQFYITRFLADPIDSNTYYVRAYIRDKSDDSLITSVDLTDVSGGTGDIRFRGLWEVESDPTGEGRWITITTKVFTDSGYTTLSTRYTIETQEYLIQERYTPNLGFGGGGGADVNYKKIEKIIKKQLKKLPKPKETNLKPVLKAIQSIPQPKEVDFSPVIRAISNLPEPEKVNLKPLEIEIKNLSKVIKEIPEVDYKFILEAMEEMTKSVEKIVQKVNKKAKKEIKKAVSDPIKIELSRLPKEKPKKEPPKSRFLPYFQKKFK